MSGGRTKDGGSIVGASVFYRDAPESETKKPEDNLEKLDSELASGSKAVEDAIKEQQSLSSHVWICTSTHAISKVTVIDANSPADILESFHVCSSHLLCIASVPGAKEDDYRVDEELNQLAIEESELREHDEAKRRDQGELEEGDPSGIGAISFVSCAVGNDKSEDEKGKKLCCLCLFCFRFVHFHLFFRCQKPSPNLHEKRLLSWVRLFCLFC